MPTTVERVISVVRQYLCLVEGHMVNIGAETTLQGDLGMDSLDVVECAMHMETEFNINMEDEDRQSPRTVGDYVTLVRKYLHESES